MGEFRFACNHCGQRISCDSNMQGAQILCPSCQNSLTVPSPTPRPRPENPDRLHSRSPAKISGLAVGSLVCSCLLSLGCIPGIICGHLAIGQIRRNPSLLGKGMALAGLIVSYIALTGTLVFVGLKTFKHVGMTTVVRKEGEESDLMAKRGVDEVQIGIPESEAAHSMQTANSEAGMFFGRHWRATPGTGRFSYTMKVLPNEPMTLNCRYWGNDTGGREFDIVVNDKIIATQVLDRNVPDVFFDVEYKIPGMLTRGRTQVTVEFRSHTGKSAGGVFRCQMLKRS